MALHVIEAGLYSLLVDQGRPHHRGLGVPLGGAADRTSLALGNALVGNAPDAAALEITLAGPTVQADADHACVVFGAPFVLRGDRRGDRATLVAGKTFTLSSGETLHVGGTATDMRAYLCVRGGFEAPPVLGSRSGLMPVGAGQVLACSPATARPRFVRYPPAANTKPDTLRVVRGAQADWFQFEDLLNEVYAVTPASNRMGLRLEGKPLVPRRGTMPEMVSEPICPGTVQVTRDGQCIVLGVDGQTIGGYAKVAHVIAADWDRLGQLRPGRHVRFEAVTLGRACEAFRRQQAKLQAWVTRLRVAAGSEAP